MTIRTYFSRNMNQGTIMAYALLASAFFGVLTAGGVMISNFSSREAAMTIDPTSLTALPGETFTISILVSSAIPVNAFTGMVTFDHRVLSVEKIYYNTSIADLWAEEPWFSQGDGTINFTGAATRPGGFTGTGALVIVNFKAVTAGDALLQLHNARILQHDGLGTEVPLSAPIDTVFTIVPAALHTVTSNDTNAKVMIAAVFSPTDLNRDGHTTLADISIFMLYLTTFDKRGDVSGDGHVTTTDLSIILDARTRQ